MALFVTDANTGAPVAGVNVFLNGLPIPQGFNGGFDLSGQSTGSTQLLEITAPGYLPVTISFNTGSAPGGAQMLPNPGTAAPITIATSAAESAPGAGDSAMAGAQAVISQNGQVLENGLTIGGDGTATTNQSYYPGTYQVSINQNGFAPVNQTIAVQNGQTSYPVAVQSTSSASAADTQPTAAAAGIGTAQSSAVTAGSNPPDPPEFVPLAAQWNCWYTGTQVRVYIGSMFIDEAAAVHWILQGNRIPVYGYASRDYDRLGTGRALVQGQLDLNFISEGYLLTVLQNYKQQALAPSDPTTQQENQLAGTVLASQTASGQSSTQSAAITAQQNQLLQTLPPSSIDNVNAQIAAATEIDPTTGSKLSSSIKASMPNAVYATQPFDITFKFGSDANGPTRIIQGCQIISNEQVYEKDGTVLDVYGFVARSVR